MGFLFQGVFSIQAGTRTLSLMILLLLSSPGQSPIIITFVEHVYQMPTRVRTYLVYFPATNQPSLDGDPHSQGMEEETPAMEILGELFFQMQLEILMLLLV